MYTITSARETPHKGTHVVKWRALGWLHGLWPVCWLRITYMLLMQTPAAAERVKGHARSARESKDLCSSSFARRWNGRGVVASSSAWVFLASGITCCSFLSSLCAVYSAEHCPAFFCHVGCCCDRCGTLSITALAHTAWDHTLTTHTASDHTALVRIALDHTALAHIALDHMILARTTSDRTVLAHITSDRIASDHTALEHIALVHTTLSRTAWTAHPWQGNGASK